MAKVLITEQYLTDIADAIRQKKASEDTYNPSEMADAIESIQTAEPATLITKSITENGTYSALDDDADGYSSVTVDVPTSSGVVEPFDTYEFNIPADINYKDETGTSLRKLATLTYHQATLDKLAEYANISSTDYPFAKTGYARVLFRVEPKNKSQITADSTYKKAIRKDTICYAKVNTNNKVSRSSPYLRARWSMATNGTLAYAGSFNTTNDTTSFDVTIASESTAFVVQTQLTGTTDQMMSAGDYVVKLYDVTWSVM